MCGDSLAKEMFMRLHWKWKIQGQNKTACGD